MLMASQKANAARLKSAGEFGKTEMSEGSQFYQSTLRAPGDSTRHDWTVEAGHNALRSLVKSETDRSPEFSSSGE
jgi:hypothetical protein